MAASRTAGDRTNPSQVRGPTGAAGGAVCWIDSGSGSADGSRTAEAAGGGTGREVTGRDAYCRAWAGFETVALAWYAEAGRPLPVGPGPDVPPELPDGPDGAGAAMHEARFCNGSRRGK